MQLTAAFWKWVSILGDMFLNYPCPLLEPILSCSSESMEWPGNSWPQAVLSPFSCPSIPEPGENPAALLIGGSDSIVITALNGSRLQTLKQLDLNGTHGLDFNHKEESVCWVTSSGSTGQLRCARMRKASGLTKEQEVKTVQNLHGTFHARCERRLWRKKQRLLFWKMIINKERNSITEKFLILLLERSIKLN